MSIYTLSYFPSHTGECNIAVHTWIPSCPPDQIKGVIQYVHGMSEYAKRIEHVALFLNDLGFVFAGEDHAGHGESIADEAHMGFFADKDGWNKAVLDTFELHKILKRTYPGKSQILYGHSMGSFIARDCAARFPNEFNAFIFSGTAGHHSLILLGILIANIEILLHGPMGKCPLLDTLVFAPFVKSVKNYRTDFDWISSDAKVVYRYIEDPLCGYGFTCAGYRDLFIGLRNISRRNWATNVANVPIYIISGDEDPVGGMGKGVREVSDRLIKSGKTRVMLQLYKAKRHELHNEVNSDEVLKGIAAFLKNCI